MRHQTYVATRFAQTSGDLLEPLSLLKRGGDFPDAGTEVLLHLCAGVVRRSRMCPRSPYREALCVGGRRGQAFVATRPSQNSRAHSMAAIMIRYCRDLTEALHWSVRLCGGSALLPCVYMPAHRSSCTQPTALPPPMPATLSQA